MAKKEQLRETRAGTVINKTSSKQEKAIITAISQACVAAEIEHKLKIIAERQLALHDVVEKLRSLDGFKEVEFRSIFSTTHMKPDGGILYIEDREGKRYPILIAEVKNQGTNDLRAQEGLKQQAQGNAIERLGKNVIGFRTWMINEDIFPFVCFGYGFDFHEASTILDRVTTINAFGPLNTFAVNNQGLYGKIQRGCFYFRKEEWTVNEMLEKISEVISHSITYYRQKYPEVQFKYVTSDAVPSSTAIQQDMLTKDATNNQEMEI